MSVCITVTSISEPTAAMRELAAGARRHGWQLICAGDAKGPERFELPGCRFLSLEDQLDSAFELASALPTNHYCRKNIAYLTAIRDGCELIVETDDDNFPMREFFEPLPRTVESAALCAQGWVNVYRYFSDHTIWPRGLPLEMVREQPPAYSDLSVREIDCPIQQGLVDDNPDVDSIFRLTRALPVQFTPGRRVAATNGVWSPFNSQNTTWWPAAFPLLYLPAHCSFRMTDIWRGMVALRVAWANDWAVLYHGPTARQQRNQHDLMRDFADEIPGYLNNAAIAQRLSEVEVVAGREHIPANLRRCYEALIQLGVVHEAELPLLTAWLDDLDRLGVL